MKCRMSLVVVFLVLAGFMVAQCAGDENLDGDSSSDTDTDTDSDTDTDTDTGWTQVGDDLETGAPSDFFGRAVGLNNAGSILAIGAPWVDGAFEATGVVSVHELNGSDWQQIGDDIEGTGHWDYLGWTVSMNDDGSVVATGSGMCDDFRGCVRVYENNGGTWQQIGNDIPGENDGEMEGEMIDISDDGNIVAIGAMWNGDNGTNTGQVRVFENVSGSWVQVGGDIYGNNTFGGFFGYDVGLSADGSILAVGAPYDDGPGNNWGRVYVFQNVAGNWQQLGNYIDGQGPNRFGLALDLSADGTVLVAGSSFVFKDLGFMRMYEYTSGSWIQVGSDIEGDVVDDDFGHAVTLSDDGSTFAVGYGFWIDDDRGYIKVYENNGGTIEQKGERLEGPIPDQRLGFSLSLNADGSILAAGGQGDSITGVAGVVKVYEFVE